MRETTNRRDHCFLFRDSNGNEGIAFCRARGFDRGEATTEVKRVLSQASDGWEKLAYLGPLGYEEMDDGAAGLLNSFSKHDPVWFAYLSPDSPR